MSTATEPRPAGDILPEIIERTRERARAWNELPQEERDRRLAEQREERRREQLVQMQARIEAKLAVVPRRYKNAGLTSSQLTDWCEDLINATRNRDSAGIKGLVLAGGTGTGKTTALWAIYAELVTHGILSVECKELSDLYRELEPASGISPQDTFHRLEHAGLVMLDDLGAERLTEWREGVLLQVINKRYVQEVPIVVATNIDPKDFTNVFGARIAGRLKELCDVVDFSGEDKRFIR